jgi:hypothetical protein
MMSMKHEPIEKQVIGCHTRVAFLDNSVKPASAKVDTGAASSSVWASNLAIDDKGHLHFVLFDKDSRYYTGKEIVKEHYRIKVIRSSNGHEQIRYTVKLRVSIENRKFLATFTLADRSRNTFPVLIGSRLLKNKFLVDVSKGFIPEVYKNKSDSLTQLAQDNPKEFFNQYYAAQAAHGQKEQ